MLTPDASKYFFINQGMLTIDHIDDAQDMRDTMTAFDVLMFTHVIINKFFFLLFTKQTFFYLKQEQQTNLFKCTSGIVNWGNTQWKQRPREEQAEPESTDEINIAAKLFGIDESDLVKGLTKPRIKVSKYQK